jgi:hypothetical protein
VFVSVPFGLLSQMSYQLLPWLVVGNQSCQPYICNMNVPCLLWQSNVSTGFRVRKCARVCSWISEWEWMLYLWIRRRWPRALSWVERDQRATQSWWPSAPWSYWCSNSMPPNLYPGSVEWEHRVNTNNERLPIPYDQTKKHNYLQKIFLSQKNLNIVIIKKLAICSIA